MTRVAFLASELSPFSKTGGLADVAGALPPALARLGLDVTVFTPYYRGAAATCARLGLTLEESAGPPLTIDATPQPVRYLGADHAGCRVVFVANDAYYDRPGLYLAGNGADHPDSVARFAFFCRAALEYWSPRTGTPDVLHLNDWQTALVAVYLRTQPRYHALAGTRTVFTIHNLTYQGMWPAHLLAATGLDSGVFQIGGLEFYGHLNLMKGGLLFADAITTVSPSYAEEIQTPAGGHGLDGVIRAQRAKLRGISNGIDTSCWNPASDPHLPAAFGAAEPHGKVVCKAALQSRLGLAVDPRVVLFGVISRFQVQKGMSLVADAMRMLAPLPWQLAVLGAGDAAIEQQMRALAAAFPGRVGLTIGFDEPLAHLIEAGSDAFLMPSAFEPCGLNQMYSQRYGTVPVVRATGGLKDTVVDCSPATLAAGTASGLIFHEFSPAHLAEGILRAWRLYTDEPGTWERLRRSCMTLDNSWTRAASTYLALYAELLDTA